MPDTRLGTLLRHLFAGRHSATPDAELLERFVQHGDDAAFTALVRRYGPLVLGVGQRVLGQEQDAEDVFQATFLVLARKAGTIRQRTSLGSWLYGVAFRLARKARTQAARRSRLERRVTPEACIDPAAALTWSELRGVLDEELARLPERYRAPLVLCYFEGLTQDEAARQLGWAKRTVKSRLARGRERLRRSLTRRGLTLGAALTAPLLATPAPAETLVAVTVRAAHLFAAGEIAAGAASAAVRTLAEGGLAAMFLSKVKVMSMLLLAAVLLAGGTGVLLSQGEPQARVEAEPPAAVPAEQARPAPPADALPAGAVVRLGTTRFRHGSFGLNGIAFLPDGKTVVTAGLTAQTVQFWEASTGRLLREVSTGSLLIRGFALSADGKRLAMTGDLASDVAGQLLCVVRILDVSSGKVLVDLARSSNEIEGSPVFTQDGRHLATLYPEGTLRIEEIPSGVEVLRHQFPRSGGRRPLALSLDGTILAGDFGPNPRGLYVWDWKKRAEPRELMDEGFMAWHSALSADGKQLAASSMGRMDGKIRIWDTDSGRLLRQLERPEVKDCSPYRLAFSPDGRTLASSNSGQTQEGKIQLWDLASGLVQGELDCGTSRPGLLAFSADSRRLAVSTDTAVRVWDLASKKELTGSDAAHDGLVHRIAYSAHGLIATGSSDHTARVWNATTGQQNLKLMHGREVQAVAFSPDGSLLATSCMGGPSPTSGHDDVVCVWNAQTGQQVHKFVGHGTAAPNRALGFMPDGKRLLSWGADFHLRIWDLTTGKPMHDHLLQPSGVTMPPKAGPPPPRVFFFAFIQAAFSADGRSLVLGLSAHFHVFDVATGKETAKFPREGGHLTSLAVSPDGKLLLARAMGKQGEIKLPDGRTRGFTEKNQPLGLWELASGKLLRLEMLAEGGVEPVAFSADGQRIAAAVSKPEPALRFWDVASGKELPALTGFRGDVHTLAFSPDGKRLAAGMKDTSTLVWDLTRRR